MSPAPWFKHSWARSHQILEDGQSGKDLGRQRLGDRFALLQSDQLRDGHAFGQDGLHQHPDRLHACGERLLRPGCLRLTAPFQGCIDAAPAEGGHPPQFLARGGIDGDDFVHTRYRLHQGFGGGHFQLLTLIGMWLMAYSARAVMVKLGLTPRLAGKAAPSTMYIFS